MMIRRELLRRVGEFDRRLFFEQDDTDFCYRIKRVGGKIYYCPQYEIVHLGQRSISQWNKKDKIDVRTYSHFIFYSKYKGKIRLFLMVFKIIIEKIIIRGISLIFNSIFLIRGIKPEKEERQLYFNTISTDIRNLFRVIFNLLPQFK